MFSVDTTMMLPMTEIIIRQMMWMLRSLKRPDVYVTTRDTMNVNIHTGAVIRRVCTLGNPRVRTMVGKKYWNLHRSVSHILTIARISRYIRNLQDAKPPLQAPFAPRAAHEVHIRPLGVTYDWDSNETCCSSVNRYSRGSLSANITPSLMV